jgi:hypothetical protein
VVSRLIWESARSLRPHPDRRKRMASSSSGVVKRERGDDEVEDTAKQAKCVKEESSMKPMVPKIEGPAAAGPSPRGVSLRQINLEAGRLPGHCADGRILDWPTWGGWKKEYYITERGTVELVVKPAQVVKAEPRAIPASKVSVQDATAAAVADPDVSIYEVLVPVLTEMIGPRMWFTTDQLNSCPFSLEGIAEIEGRLGSELFEPIACNFEWPNREQQGKMRCETCCPRKSKKGWHGLHAHAQAEKIGRDTMAELHKALLKVMNTLSANGRR